MARAIFNLLYNFYYRCRVDPPTVRMVCWQSSMVYLFSVAYCTWLILEVPWSPVSLDDRCNATFENGPFTLTMSYGLQALANLIPMMYVAYARLRVWWEKLMPESGRTQAVSTYFLRILLVFFACYFPAIIFGATASVVGGEGESWLNLASVLFNPFQFLLSFRLAMDKPDVRAAVFLVTNRVFPCLKLQIENYDASETTRSASRDGKAKKPRSTRIAIKLNSSDGMVSMVPGSLDLRLIVLQDPTATNIVTLPMIVVIDGKRLICWVQPGLSKLNKRNERITAGRRLSLRRLGLRQKKLQSTLHRYHWKIPKKKKRPPVCDSFRHFNSRRCTGILGPLLLLR